MYIYCSHLQSYLYALEIVNSKIRSRASPAKSSLNNTYECVEIYLKTQKCSLI